LYYKNVINAHMLLLNALIKSNRETHRKLLLNKDVHINDVIFRSTTSTDLFNDRHKE